MGQAPVLIQLSDCHLMQDKTKSLNSVNPYQSLESVLSAVKKNKLSHLLFSGDLAQDEVEPTYHHYLNLCGDISCPIYAIPGNHDNPQLIQKVLAERNWSQDKHFDYANWRVILLNSHYPKHTEGLLSQQELERLSDLLESWSGQVLIFLHHHLEDPAVVYNGKDISLINSLDFFDICLPHQQKIKAIVSGHVHAEYEMQYKGLTLLTTPSTCYEFAVQEHKIVLDNKPPAYRWFELNDDGKLVTGVERVSLSK
jgi:3',5'-cyclic-AMP phosphodiesterase